MKAVYVCRACERRLKGPSLSPATWRLDRQSVRPFSTHRPVRKSPHGSVKRQSLSYATTPNNGTPRAVPIAVELRNDHSTEQNEEAMERLAQNSQVLRALSGDQAPPQNRETPHRRRRDGSRPSVTPIRQKTTRRRANPSNETTYKTRSGAILRKNDIAKIKEKKKTFREIQWAQVKRSAVSEDDLIRSKKKFVDWKGRFARLHQWRSHPRQPSWRGSGSWLWDLNSVEEMKSAWAALDVTTREEVWPDLMLSTLSSRPHQAHRVLHATLDPLPPSYAVQDTLQVVVKTLAKGKLASDWDDMGHQNHEDVAQLMLRILSISPQGYQPFTQVALGHFAKRASRANVKKFYDGLKDYSVPLSDNTALQFANKLGKSSISGRDEYKVTALEILLNAADQGVDLNQPKVAGSITTLLKCGPYAGHHRGDFSPDAALHDLIEKGFLPNAIHTLSFFGTLCRRGQVDEAIQITRLFARNGVKLGDGFYYQAFSTVRDNHRSEYLEEMLKLMESVGIKEEIILSKALSAVYTFCKEEYRTKRHQPDRDQQPFLNMLRIYQKKFALEPLQELIPDSLPLLLMQQPNVSDSSTTTQHWDYEDSVLSIASRCVQRMSEKQLRPTMDTIGIMFRGYILSSWRPYDILALYQHFKVMLESGSPVAVGLVKRQRSRIHDTFIHALLSHEGLVRPALQVFGDMLQDGLWEPGASESGSVKNRKPCHPEPSVYTYCILVDGLSRQNEKAMAAQILDIMKENKIKPNLPMMNVQIKSLATTQNAKAVVRLMQSLESEGFEPDRFTMAAFNKLHDKQRALKMMETIIKEKSKRLGEQQLVDLPQAWAN